MDYVLVDDNCDNCQYVKHAFLLLKLTLHTTSLNDLTAAMSQQTSALIVCKHLEDDHEKLIQKLIDHNNTPLISFKDPTSSQQYTLQQAIFLKPHFSMHDLKEALSHCHNQIKGIPDIIDYNYTIFEKLVGPSQHVAKIKLMIKQVAASDSTVLILGQSGTGKDVIASCIHYLSDRKSNPLVPINCGAIPSELMESELFGHEKGAFTGALTKRPGRFEIANKGTLFLDEIGDMPLQMQVKLLRVIQERKIERVGSSTSLDVDVRLIAATNKNLEELIHEHKFREDLYYRINVFPIYVPSLAERSEDIPALIDYHLDKVQTRLKHRVAFTSSALEVLSHYPWPGNVRELQNFLERMVVLYPDQVLNTKDLDAHYREHKPIITSLASNISDQETFNIKEYLTKIESQIIDTALKRSNHIVSNAAEWLSISKTTLVDKMKKYNLIKETAEE